MPDDDVFVVDAGAAVADPLWEAERGVAGGLGDMAAGRVKLSFDV